MYRGQAAKMVRLWVHECDRTYLDRLITEKDQQTYKEYLQKAFKNFEEDPEEVFVEDNIFTSFVAVHGGNDKSYIPIKDMPQLKKCLEDRLNDYNAEKAAMDLVLFDMAMEHICRIARIIDMPNGNALLVGVGGSGKQSLSRLAAFILDFEVIQILVSQSYTINELKTDIQEMFIKAGIKAGGIPCVFLLTDT
jgi:dynein heavy chain